MSNSGLRTMAVMWVLLLLLGVVATLALYFGLEPQEDPLLTAAVVGGITFSVFLFGLFIRPVTLAGMTRTGDEIKLKTLSRPGEWQRYSVADVVWVRHHKGSAGYKSGSPETVSIKLRGRRFSLSVYPNYKRSNCDVKGVLALDIRASESDVRKKSAD